MTTAQPELAFPGQIFSVTELTRRIKTLLETRVGSVWVEGEISNYRAQPSGHRYFTLKDAGAQLAAVLFRGDATGVRFELADGLQVIAHGEVSVYEARGQYQLIVRELLPKGLGALQLAFEQLKRKLEAEGLFAPERKRPIPRFVRHVGLITSPSGAAVRDFLQVAGRRFPGLHVVIAPVRVQGEGAATEIAAAVDELNALHKDGWLELDVLVLARGGGSLEDLWAFNEEIVARAVARSRLPTVSAVGHEIDFTICDFVADLRAPTPSAAAELIVPSRADLLGWLADSQSRLGKDLRLQLAALRDRLQRQAGSPALREPLHEVRQFQQRVDWLEDRLERAPRQARADAAARLRTAAEKFRVLTPREQMRIRRQHCRHLAARLDASVLRWCKDNRGRLVSARQQLLLLSPQRTLERGYSISRRARDGQLIRSVRAVEPGEMVRTTVADGEFTSQVR